MTAYKNALENIRKVLNGLSFVKYCSYLNDKNKIGNNLDAILIEEGDINQVDKTTGNKNVVFQNLSIYHLTSINNDLPKILDRQDSIVKAVLADASQGGNVYDTFFISSEINSGNVSSLSDSIQTGINANLAVRKYNFKIYYCF